MVMMPTAPSRSMRMCSIETPRPQQMRGSGSPSGSASSRRPTPVSRMTEPACSAMHVPTIAASPPQRVRAQRRQHARPPPRAGPRSRPCPRWPREAGRCRGARRPRAPPAVTGTCSLVEHDADAALLRHLVERAREAAARRVLHRRHRAVTGRERAADEAVERGHVGAEVALELELAARAPGWRTRGRRWCRSR